MAAFEFSSCVRVNHSYKEIWSPVLGEELSCSRESNNDEGLVAVMKASIHDNS